jgi:hypothetical protein
VLVYPKLLKQWTTYFAGFVALLLISPHLYWQYNHDFISFDYHLFQRTSGGFEIEHVLGYIAGTMGILNPALFVLVTLITFKFKKHLSDNGRLYLRVFWGVIIFFFFYSFRSRIEAHWVVAALIPMVLVLHEIVIGNRIYKKAVKVITLISVGLILILRLAFVFSISFQKLTLGTSKEFLQKIKKVVPSDAKVVFMNSFQKPSKYRFYFDENAFSYNSVYYRKNQYDLGDYDTCFNNAKVLFKGYWKTNLLDTMRLEDGSLLRYAIIDKYKVFTKVKGELVDFSGVLNKGKGEVNVNLENPYNYEIEFGEGRFPITIKLMLENKDEEKFFINLNYDLKKLEANSVYSEKMTFEVSDLIPDGKYKCQIVFNYIYAQYVSRKVDVEVQK